MRVEIDLNVVAPDRVAVVFQSARSVCAVDSVVDDAEGKGALVGKVLCVRNVCSGIDECVAVPSLEAVDGKIGARANELTVKGVSVFELSFKSA